MIGTGVTFLVHRHRQDAQIGLVTGENNFFDRRLLRRDDSDLALLLFELGDLEADLHRRFDIAHVEGIGDVLARHPWIVKHWKGRFLAV